MLGLQAKVALLDDVYVSGVISQLKMLLDSLKELQCKAKELETDPEHKSKVSQLCVSVYLVIYYHSQIAEALQTMSRVTPLITLVPDLVGA